MTLRDLLERLAADQAVDLADAGAPALSKHVTAIDYDSRKAASGSVFVALRGSKADGAAFAADAVQRGALAVISESPAPQDFEAPWIVVADGRRALAACAAILYRHPSEELLAIGITGTNGKTTTTYLVASIFEAAGYRIGRIGTIGYRIGGVEHESSRTTPEAPDVQRMLREMVDERCAACVMEVSSHALALHRVDRMRFSAAVFSNLTRDHLDFHRGMEDYFLAKRRLFELLGPGAPAVINIDDPYGARLERDFPHAVTYALGREADVFASEVTFSLDGLTFDIQTPRGIVHVRSRLVGRPNAYNILAAVATAAALDLPAQAIERGLTALEAVPGRFQVVSSDLDDVQVVVDYAHTDDALRNLLETARPMTSGQVISVFGCGGDRDRAKRPLMGAVAARLSDRVVLTSDNPRSEDPQAIVDEIKRGFVVPDRPATRGGQPVPTPKTVAWTSILDRAQAIATAVSEAAPGDLVLIAGKGHEKSLVVGDRSVPFDDVEVARTALRVRREHMPVGGQA